MFGGRRCFVLIAFLAVALAKDGSDDSPCFPFMAPPPSDADVQLKKDENTGFCKITYLEETTIPFPLLQLKCTGSEDPTYKVWNGDGSALGLDFFKKGENWILNITKRQDREKHSAFSIDIDKCIPGDPPTGLISVLDIDDNPPILSSGSTICPVPENWNGTTECFITVTDEDETVGDLTVEIQESGMVTDTFDSKTEISSDTVKVFLTVPRKLNYEEKNIYSLDFVVRDPKYNNSFSTQASIVVNVQDVADQPPVWYTRSPIYNIIEEESFTVQLKASDGDVKINDSIYYRLNISSGNEDYFSVDKDTGILTVNPIDRDKPGNDKFEFEVIAYEANPPPSETDYETPMTLIFMIGDKNDNLPKFTSDPITTSVDEGSSSLSISEIVVEDPDLSENGTFNVELVANGDGTDFLQAFTVVPNQGYQKASFSVLVADPSLLDYENEKWRNIHLMIRATEKADSSHTAEQELIINLNNINDEFPEFPEKNYAATVMENAKAGTLITTLTAIDNDGLIGSGGIDKITYSTTSGSFITIDSVTGEVKVAKDNSFDFELEEEVTVQVTATDLENHANYTQLKITIHDVNDVAPTLHMPGAGITVMENAPIDIITGTEIMATDPDTDADLHVRIDWATSSATSNGIAVNETDFVGYIDIEEDPNCEQKDVTDSRTVCAVLKVVKRLHWEIFNLITLNITVRDNATDEDYPERAERSATVTITIKDVNDNAPDIKPIGPLSVVENAQVGQTIGNVVATDKDFNQNLEYSLTPLEGTPADWVTVDQRGVLSVSFPQIDCDGDYSDVLKYNVTVSDGLNHATEEINIQVEDVNDMPPVILNTAPLTATIPENSEDGVFIYQIKAKDGDRTEPFNKVSYLIDPLYPNYWFAIDIETGDITVSLSPTHTLNIEAQETYDIHVVVRDNYNATLDYNSNPTPTYVTLNLTDVNDNYPEFIDVPQPCQGGKEFLETMAEMDLLVSISAKDDDIYPSFSAINFTIVDIQPLDGATYPSDGETHPLFIISTSYIDPNYRGDIFAGRPLLGYIGHYNVTIEAYNFKDSDNPNPSYKTYTICIKDVNDHPPVITFPEKNQTFLIFDTQELDSTIQTYGHGDLPLLSATDADYGDNGRVEFDLVGTDIAKKYFKIISSDEENTGKLVLRRKLDIATLEEREFELQINATDNGMDKQLHDVSSMIFRVLTNEPNDPYFLDRNFNVSFEENQEASFNFPEAYDADNLYKPGDLDKIYYYLVDGNETLFSVDKNNATVRLVKGLDYEYRHNYSILIRASNNETEPDSSDSTEGADILNITVYVTDVNDEKPRFKQKLYTGGIAPKDPIGKQVLQVEAVDPDTNDHVKYALMWETMQANGTLAEEAKNSFELDPKTGSLTLKFQPQESMNGLFTFKINATDDNNHFDIVPIQVYPITNDNRETFIFQNPKDFVDSKSDRVSQVLTESLKYTCNIYDVQPKADDNGRPTNNTAVYTFFMDDNAHMPVDSVIIHQDINNNEIQTQINEAFRQIGLDWVDFQGVKQSTSGSDTGFQQTILIGVSAVLAILVLLLLMAFFFKTRSLNRRLEALSQTKFGSLDSGLNRVNMNVPNTNQHALEGSNPVWNEEIDNGDTTSQYSGDSDLVGIEDSPEFKQQGGANDQTKANEIDGNYGNQNFSFGTAKPSEPTTEL